MLQWIDVYVINVRIEIILVEKRMLPIPALPDSRLPLYLTGFAAYSTGTYLTNIIPGENAFDLFPPHGIISIVFGQFPNGMNMFREQTHGNGFKRVAGLYVDPGIMKDVTALLIGK
jgi:hypothetical protein